MIAFKLWWRLARRQESHRLITALAVIAFAVTTAAVLIVLGGLGAFLGRPDSEVYVMCAQVATAILIIPVITLGGAAARLSVSRRNERFAALRLAGATSGQVGAIAVIDATMQAVIGVLAGGLLYLIALPGVALLRFQGRPFELTELWVGPGILALSLLGVVLLAIGSAAASLAAVVISPLGVARRVSPKKLSVIRVLIFVVAFIAWLIVSQLVSGEAIIPVLSTFLVICFAVVNLVGPFVLGLIGRIAAGGAKNVPALLAARRLIDDPKSAWRSVAGVTLATFVAGMLSIAPAMAEGFQSDEPTLAYLPQDLLTGALVTVVIAAILAAVSSGVNQAAKVLDHRDQYRTLRLAGTPIEVLTSARLRETWLPLAASLAIAVTCSLVIVAPFGLMMIGASLAGPLLFGGAIVLSVTLVMLAVLASQPLVHRAAAL
ncbi:hypothetical protein [Microlunatus speluncae]|uniref:hypothetical protein n=1 Tax=Microlunatus speluncae TaxID=2594267 RepID=UPI0012667F34|nr:hypothetical protein [Microlunatus speluncae]